MLCASKKAELNQIFLNFLKDEYMPPIVIEKKELTIEGDMQLKSNYLDKKVKKKEREIFFRLRVNIFFN